MKFLKLHFIFLVLIILSCRDNKTIDFNGLWEFQFDEGFFIVQDNFDLSENITWNSYCGLDEKIFLRIKDEHGTINSKCILNQFLADSINISNNKFHFHFNSNCVISKNYQIKSNKILLLDEDNNKIGVEKKIKEENTDYQYEFFSCADLKIELPHVNCKIKKQSFKKINQHNNTLILHGENKHSYLSHHSIEKMTILNGRYCRFTDIKLYLTQLSNTETNLLLCLDKTTKIEFLLQLRSLFKELKNVNVFLGVTNSNLESEIIWIGFDSLFKTDLLKITKIDQLNYCR